ncbi:MAG TPA: thioesterase family protein [Pusillimonas sp.]|uniref:acyl-CoA thioesterase n=1 Tax=Pusillimonas sp. TaxID=3040095 RepID=UPI002BD9EB85|nr:thioesterase family protein [Pusillimonas sp.]HUH88320.1 thioesterase family protein [Pusillimonas sp.]
MLQHAASATPQIGHVFECVIPVRWGDQDALGHVNNTLYLKYCEEARAQLYTCAGYMVPGEREAVLVHVSCDFLKPLMYPATVVLRFVFTRLGRSSMEYDFVIERQDEPGVVYAHGKNITVNTDPATGKSCAWTAQELNNFARCFVAAAAP